MNKKADAGDVGMLILVGICLLAIAACYLIDSSYYKIRYGCWSWSIEEQQTNYTLVSHYNYTCEEVKDMILTEVYTHLNSSKVEQVCKSKVISTKMYQYWLDDLREDYYKECTKHGN
jgi:hypothetical protein